MFPVRMFFGVAVVAGLLILGGQRARAQDDDEKKKEKEKLALKELLQKAEDEYRTFFRRPEQVHEFWAAIKFEVEVGKFDVAALHLKQLLAKAPPEDADKELVNLAEVEGLAPFLRLANIRKWSDHKPFQDEAEKSVQQLLDRLTAAVEKTHSDPQRLTKFIARLDAPTPEERAYAFAQLQRAKERAAPYLVEALRLNVGKPLHKRIVDVMLKLDSDIVPPLLEVFKARDERDAQDSDLRITLLDIVRKRGDKRVVPYLWHLSSAAMYSPQVRQTAKKYLADFLNVKADKLPDAKVALTDLAENYYQHKVRFLAGKAIRIWPWDGQKLATQPVSLTPGQAEEFFGVRHAREAIDLDPTYQPAQTVFLSLMLERTVAPNLNHALLKPMGPNLQNLLATVDADLLTRVLERALDETKIPVILPTVHALGERGDARTAKLGAGGSQRGLLRALHFPDRRVQYAAVKAMLKMPTTPAPQVSARTVDVLRRLLAAGEAPKALAVYVPQDKSAEVRKAIKSVGYEPVLTKDVRSAFEKLEQTADYDLIILFPGMADKEFPFVVNQFRSDADHGRLPILVFAPKGKEEELARQAERYANVKIYPEIWLSMTDELKGAVDEQLKAASGAKLSADERKEFSRVALDVLWRMGRGEIQGYDLRPAQETIARAATNPTYATEALEILSRLPGQEPQARLASVILDPASKFRVPAAMELNRSIQKFGLQLSKLQEADLRTSYQSEADQALKAQLALLVGSMRATPQATGQRLFEFRPDVQAPPPPQKKDKDGK